jgi:hypothetical protein
MFNATMAACLEIFLSINHAFQEALAFIAPVPSSLLGD